MMSDEECEIAFHRLAESLEKNKLKWVVDAVKEDIQAGKLVQKKVRAWTEEADSSTKKPSTALTNFLASEELTAQEQLLLLISATERIVVNTAKMKAHVINTLSSKDTQKAEVTFEGVNSKGHGFSGDQTASLATAAKLQRALDSLRDATTNDDIT